MKKTLDPTIIAKGQAALAKYRAEKAAATAKGPAALAKWQAKRDKKKVIKITPMSAIKAFCLSCVGDSVNDVKNCTAPQCALYTVRPYK
jgi:hypothetical protein